MSNRKKTFVGLLGKKRVFVDANGNLMLGTGGPDIDTFRNADSMAINRDNCTEFGQASHIGAIFRFTLQRFNYFFRTLMHSDLNTRLRTIARNDKSHLSGQGSFNLKEGANYLEHFNFSDLAYINIVSVDKSLTIDPDRKVVAVLFSSFEPVRDLNFPSKTDFFRLFMTATVISAFDYDDKTKKYVPPENQEVIITKIVETEKLSKVLNTSDINMEIQFDDVPKPEESVIICLGVEFFDISGSNIFMKREWAAMEICRVV